MIAGAKSRNPRFTQELRTGLLDDCEYLHVQDMLVAFTNV
jgi:hypothetical protein